MDGQLHPDFAEFGSSAPLLFPSKLADFGEIGPQLA
jgi:hypothetical protein